MIGYWRTLSAVDRTCPRCDELTAGKFICRQTLREASQVVAKRKFLTSNQRERCKDRLRDQVQESCAYRNSCWLVSIMPCPEPYSRPSIFQEFYGNIIPKTGSLTRLSLPDRHIGNGTATSISASVHYRSSSICKLYWNLSMPVAAF